MFYIFVSLLNLSVDVSPPVATHWNHRLPAVNSLAVKYMFPSHNYNYCSLTPQTIISIYCIVKLHCLGKPALPMTGSLPAAMAPMEPVLSQLPPLRMAVQRWRQMAAGFTGALTGFPVMAHRFSGDGSQCLGDSHPSVKRKPWSLQSQSARPPASSNTDLCLCQQTALWFFLGSHDLPVYFWGRLVQHGKPNIQMPVFQIPQIKC